MELRSITGDKKIEVLPVICDLRVAPRLRQVFGRLRPQVVFHAAAHKHVPLLESNVAEAVFNNISGTSRLLECADEFKVERCVMVSTDKAVNPTNIMGATKRVAELMFQAQAFRLNGDRHYSCVRFGNVLGSRGSVIPIFRDQIKHGGPVTITHPNVERYFMTIPEAAQLIIQAGALGQRGEIFLLDMGEPVKVVDLAKDMIRLSGLNIGEDIDIEFTGLRPGEKLKEELLIAEEGAQTTRYEKIFVAPPLQYDFRRLDEWIAKLTAAAETGSDQAIYEIFSAMDIGFCPAQARHDDQSF
jgi:FlaA1/EpsC-like NDP-sugar epimerase